MDAVLSFIAHVYRKLELGYSLELSSRPEQFIGEVLTTCMA